MIQLSLIGIGTGNPDHLTGEARRAMAEADLFLVPHKGAGKSDLADLRTQIIDSVRDDAHVALFDMPVR
ncbi:MAG: SAM-dependent methyltransferase, partial [Pseudomonadota bacterium]